MINKQDFKKFLNQIETERDLKTIISALADFVYDLHHDEYNFGSEEKQKALESVHVELINAKLILKKGAFNG